MPLTLSEDSVTLADVCRNAEGACAALTAAYALPVVLLEHFRDLPEASTAPSYAATPAAYRKSDATIYVNAESFFAMGADERVAVLVHEVGHALTGGDCFDADMFACEYGQEATLLAERAKHYGSAAGAGYAAALRQWKDPARARAAFAAWRTKKLIGAL